MNEAVLKEYSGEIRYEVYHDHDDFHNTFNEQYGMHFESEQEKEEYKQKFINDELCSYGVVKLIPCKCCTMWSELESIWGIHAESAEEALRMFKENL